MTKPERYRKKPVDIEAMKLTVDNIAQVAAWVMDHGGGSAGLLANASGPIEERCLIIGTLEGDMRASLGDYVIRGIDGEFYPCKPDIFHRTYDRVLSPEDFHAGV